MTPEGSSRSARHAWLDILQSVVIVAAAFLITSPIADGTTRFLLMLVVAIVAGLSMRAAGLGWRRAQGGRRGGGA